jgi:hypothetical protein
MDNTPVVGFDIEWKVTFTSEVRKTALIQLCPSKDICYLFHICVMNGKVLYRLFICNKESDLFVTTCGTSRG